MQQSPVVIDIAFPRIPEGLPPDMKQFARQLNEYIERRLAALQEQYITIADFDETRAGS